MRKNYDLIIKLIKTLIRRNNNHDRNNVRIISKIYVIKPVSYTHLDVYKRQELKDGRY